MKFPRSIIVEKKEHPPIHPTQKPVALIEYLIRTYTNEFRRWLKLTGGLDAIPHEVSTRASRVPRASGVAVRLASVSRFARINPWINALGLALDLFELYRSIGKDIPEHIQYSNGGVPGSGDVWCGPVQKWVQPRQIWSPVSCGSEQSFKVSQWDNGPFGPVISYDASGKVTQLRWRGIS